MLDESPPKPLESLGKSNFVHEVLAESIFTHFYHQIDYVYRKYRPAKMLEIGPGDHTVTDFLRRRGIEVKTLDATAQLRPDYLCDIREPFPITESFDLVLASEVFEHVDIKWLPQILENIKKALRDHGYLVVSLPYATLRFFPPNDAYGKFVSCTGRVVTRIPFTWIQPLYSLIRGLYRFLILRYTFKGSFKFYRIPEVPDDKIDVHHWEVGRSPTSRAVVRKILQQHFTLLEEKAYPGINCIFFVLRKD